MTEAPSIKEALEQISDMPCSMVNDADSLRYTIKTMRRIATTALATLSQPTADRREIVARILFARLFRQPLDPRVQVWENYNSALHRPYYDAADAILAALDGGAGA